MRFVFNMCSFLDAEGEPRGAVPGGGVASDGHYGAEYSRPRTRYSATRAPRSVQREQWRRIVRVVRRRELQSFAMLLAVDQPGNF